jgi:16S rRNA (guanine966-N2)-methyltransferase
MRIISGSLRGKTLQTPSGTNTRPTSDKARQGVFNILEHANWSSGIVGARVLDIFAGSGSMGLEALSRGASFAAFIDNDKEAIRIIARNIESCRFNETFAITILRNAAQLGQNNTEKFDLAFLDAPYGSGLNQKTMQILLSGNWLGPDAITICEDHKDSDPETLEEFDCIKTVNYGINAFAIYKVKPTT